MNEFELFTQAVAIQDGQERQAFLDRECAGRPELRARLEVLLAGHQRQENPLDWPPAARDFAGTVTADTDPNATVGSPRTPATRENDLGIVIAGRYTLIELIGEGGMGTVYRAEQSEPVKRQVALKLIKPGMDSRQVLARFDAERQALARMDHPNIARIFDGGVTSDEPGRVATPEPGRVATPEPGRVATPEPGRVSAGSATPGRPFFVMELVRGIPITDYCDQARLSVRARLELFVQVCQAVQHAHQKGIIHRDLKPSNILVTEVDGRATPKVIDFGVAKATEQRLTDMSIAETGAIVGTPTYMSPEQADPASMDIDTRTDVYALGVVLYELLTGSPPIDARQLRRGALFEMLRMVREVDPPRPSTKLSTADALPSIAANRNVEPARLMRMLQGEVDWIVMKALEKDRTRRYDTANGLARDIQRYLADEVVEARPPSKGYRLRKFVRRNRGRVAAAVLIFLALLGGITGTTIGLLRADSARLRAESAESAAIEERNRAILAAEAETAARLQAQEEKRQAEQARATTARQRELALNTVRSVLLRVDELMKNDARLAPLRVEIIHRMMEDVDRIRDHAQRNPLEDRTESVAYFRMGDLYYAANRVDDAIVWHEKAHAVLEKLAEESPNDPNAIRNLATSKTKLADTEWRLGRGRQARDRHQEALKLHQRRQKLLDSPGTDEIEKMSLEVDIAEAFHNLAYADLRLGDPLRAIENFELADKTFADLTLPGSNMLRVRRYRYEIMVRLADAWSRRDDMDKAEKLYRQALERRQELLQNVGSVKKTRLLIETDAGQSHMYLGDFLLFYRRDPVAAFREYERCLAIFESGQRLEPDSLDLIQRLAATFYRLGAVLDEWPASMALTGPAPLEALRDSYFTRSLNLRKQLAQIDRKDTTTQVEYLISLARVGNIEEVDRLATRLLAQAGNDPPTLLQIACAYALCARGTGNLAERNRQNMFKALEQLRRSGWHDPGVLKDDPDFYALRDDPQFRAIIESFRPK